jgi:DNA-binding beta-propeller fold protein YncE
MMKKTRRLRLLLWSIVFLQVIASGREQHAFSQTVPQGDSVTAESNLLYVASPGVRNYLEYGGHGLLVFDIDHEHRFVKRIPLGGLNESGEPINVKGICANSTTGCVYVSTIKTLMCVDIASDQLLWEIAYDGGCDRMSMDPQGRFIYLPSFEGPHWNIVDARSGRLLTKITPDSGAHNTVVGLDGRFAYLAGLKSPLLSIADTSHHQITRTVGPFAAAIRPFTINGLQTRCYVCINDLLGFEIGDIQSGEKIARVEIQGFKRGPVKRHGCPSHGIGLTPDEREVWVVDAFNQRIHLFDNTVMPPKQLTSIELRDEPGWVTFSIDGKWAYPSTGQVIDVAAKKIVLQLTDEHDATVQSEKMVQVVLREGRPVRVGDQFGVGRSMQPAQ